MIASPLSRVTWSITYWILGLSVASAGLYPNPYSDATYQYRQISSLVNYRLFVPPNYNPANKYPIVVYLHGNGEREGGFVAGDAQQYNAAQMSDTGQYAFVAPVNQAIFPCFLVLVQRTTIPMTTAKRTAIASIPAALASEYNIDLDRVILTGLSGGGGDTLDVGSQNASTFAAVVPICPVSGSTSNLTNMPMWFFHASNDNTVNYSSSLNAVNALRAAGGRPIYTLYTSGDHYIWTVAYETPALIPWLAAQKRGTGYQSYPATLKRYVPNQSGTFQARAQAVKLIGTVEPSGALDPQIGSIKYNIGSYTTGTTYSNTTGPATAWETPNLALNGTGTTRIDVVALGTSWSGLGGFTYYSDTFNATYSANGDVTNPVTQITVPTGGSTFTTPVTSLNLAGTATDNVGVTSVIWRNDRGGLGLASGTATWYANNIPLKSGVNVITIESRDAANRVGTATLTVTCTEGPPPPAQWNHLDIGSPATAGNLTANPDGSVTVSGAGTGGMWDAEQCHFAYVQASGDCSITARMLTQPSTSWNSLAGLLIQGTPTVAGLSGDNPYVMGCFETTRSAGIYTHTPSSRGASFTPDSTLKAPYWLRLVRQNGSFSYYISPSGQNGTWTQVGTSQALSMSTDVLIGLFVNSNVANTAGQAAFDNVTVDGAPMPITGYAAWAASKGLTGANVVPTLDQDNDGLNNFLEYALNSDPLSNNQAKPAISIRNVTGADYLSLEFDRRADAKDVVYTIQVCSDLTTNTWLDVGTSQTSGNSGAGFISSSGTGDIRHLIFRDTTLLNSSPRRFIRLKTTVP